MGEIQVILTNKAPVKALPLLVEVVVPAVRVREYLVLQGLFHNTGCVDIRFKKRVTDYTTRNTYVKYTI